MVFYDKNGKSYCYNLTKENQIGEGTTSFVYKLDNKCIKVSKGTDCSPLNEEMFNILRNLNLDSFVKLYDSFYSNGELCAYTMDYVKESNISILDMPTEYTIDNLNRLYKDLLILAKNYILAKDLYFRNIVVSDDKITIIDFDDYKKFSYNDDILYQNTNNLLYTFRRLYQEELINKGFDLNKSMVGDMNINKYLLYLFSYNSKEEPSRVLERKMIGSKTPMELFDRKW